MHEFISDYGVFHKEERIVIVVLVIVLSVEIENKQQNGLVDAEKRTTTERKTLHLRDLNKIASWSIFHLWLKKILKSPGEEKENSDKRTKLKARVDYLSKARTHAEETL